MTDLERAKEALTTIDCTCALCRDGEVRTTQLRGVAPLLSWLEEGLSGWSVADRVVGAGAAWLYTLLHPTMVYAPVMSRRATAILTQYGVPYICDEVAEFILNRTGTGLCPMEEATADAADPQQALAAIRESGIDKATIDNCYVTTPDHKLLGVVSLRALVLAKNTEEPIKDLMDSNVVSVSTTTDQEDVSNLFEKYGFLAIPVVDAENRLVGIVTIDDAISILQDEASEDIAKMNAIGPSDKPYFKQSMWDLYKSRAPWLLFLMISATFSSLVIRGYEDALAAVTVLTAYIPMLTDAGGNAGSQSTSTIIRGMAVGEIQPHDLPRILWRESRVALLCGATLAVCNFAKLLLFDKVTAPVALVVCLTLICTILLSQLIGGILPVAAEKLHVDPAVMASPLITTIVDATTLLIYFNVARIVLHL